MNVLLKSKIPFIGCYDNSSVIGIYEGFEKGYKFMDEWNGMFGKDCFISFDRKRPKFGQAAIDSLKTKNTFVVFDLIKIMSMPPDQIQMDKTWGFTFTKDDKNPVLLKFDTFDRTKKTSSPSFLMAMYLRQHLKAIKSKVGEKPKEIALWIFDKDFNEKERKRIKKGIKESCRLLKIDVYFVDTESSKVDFVKHCPN
uniref:Uncharacterized protein n=1 Tax=Panagrolaimus sp. PS1159 TaxID=55785 RepID=A0AC35FKR5_9BILA